MWCSRRQLVCGILLVLTGLLLLLAGVLLLFLIPSYIRQQIKQNVVLTKGSPAYETWRDPSKVAIYLQFWVFDLQNPKDVLQGERPNVTQKGPYTYREHRQKVDVDFNSNSTVSYYDNHTYVFEPSMSVGPDNETFTTVNLVPVTLMTAFEWLPELVQIILSKLLWWEGKDNDIFVEKSVHDIIWGYTDPLLQKAMSYPILKDIITSDQAGIMLNRNNSNDGLYTIFTGEIDTSKLGTVDKYDGSSYVPYWTTHYANMVNGTDGTLCQPFVTKEKEFYIFSTDLCRSVYTTFHKEITNEYGINLWRFAADKATFENATINPDNAGFCTPAGNCMDSGVLNVSSCKKSNGMEPPTVLSLPHFFLGADKYVEAIEGMHPYSGEYNTEIDVEPHTGFVMAAAKRIQLNMYLQKIPGFSQTGQMRTMVYPVLWLNESAKIDAGHANQVKNQLLIPMLVVSIAQYALMALGGLVLLCTAAFHVSLYVSKKKKNGEEPLLEAEKTQ